MSANEDLFANAVSHQVGLLRFSGSVRNKLVAHLNRVEDDLVAQIRKRSDAGSFTEWRLNKILDDVRDILNEAAPDTYGIVRDEMLGLAKHETEYQEQAIKSAVPVELNITKPTSEQLRAGVLSRPFQGKYLREWVSEMDGASRRRLRDAIRIGWTEGETIDQMVRRIRGTRALGYSDGIMEITRRNAQAMVRTAVSHTSNYSRDLLYAENQDVIKGWMFVATLDARTTEKCMALDGRVFPVGEGPKPPRHIGCRSSTSPVLKSWKEMGISLPDAPAGTRASLDGQVPAETTYGQWLKGRSASEQDDILGATKGKLFRQGGLDVTDFVDNRGKVYTLDELRVRDAAAFEKAGL